MRRPALACFAASLTALLAILLAGLDGGPYLDFDRLSPWIVVFAVALFTALFAAPFALHAGLGGRAAEPDRRWEPALLGWAGIAGGLAVVAAVLAVLTGFDGGSLAGAVAIVALVEASLILIAVGAVVLGG